MNEEVETIVRKINSLDILLETLSVNSPDRKEIIQELYSNLSAYEKKTGLRYQLRDDGK